MSSISYIITTYNRPHSLLLQAIQSVIAERIEGKTELIIVDDCSPIAAILDPSIVTAFDGQVQLIRNETNQGVIKSRNIGLRAAQYEYILFLDDDDVADPNRSRDLLTAIEGTNYAFVSARTRLYQNEKDYIVVPMQYDLPLTPIRYLCNIAHINGVIWHRKTLLDMDGFDNRVPYLGEHVTMLLLILRGYACLQISPVVSQFQFFMDGLTRQTHRQNLMKQHLIGLYTLLLEEPLPNGVRPIFEGIKQYLNEQLTLDMEDYLAHISQKYNSN